MRAPTFLVRDMWNDHSGCCSKCFWALLGGFVEIFIWIFFILLLPIVLPFYLIFGTIYYVSKGECECPKYITNYFKICFIGGAVILVACGQAN